MKRIIIPVFLILSAVLALAVFAQGTKEEIPATFDANEEIVKIGISKLMPHPALDAIEQGIKDYLGTTGRNISYDVQNANGEIASASQIAQLFKNEKTDINIAIATPTAQAIANTYSSVPLVFSSVTDPVSAGLTGDGMENVCGVSDMVPVRAHLDLISSIKDIKTLGMVYTMGEANGIVLMEEMKKACEENGIGFVSASVVNSSEVRMAAESIIDRVDAVYVATDNTVISAITALSDVCMAHKIPLFSADTTSSYGTEVLLAGGFDYYASGVQTGKIVEMVLSGASPKEIGTEYLDSSSLEIYVNLDVAEKLGLDIPADIVNDAKTVIKDGIQA